MTSIPFERTNPVFLQMLHNWSQEPSTIKCPSSTLTTIKFTMGVGDINLNKNGGSMIYSDPNVYNDNTITSAANMISMYNNMLIDYYSLFMDSTTTGLSSEKYRRLIYIIRVYTYIYRTIMIQSLIVIIKFMD
jgi:hypothetical protein